VGGLTLLIIAGAVLCTCAKKQRVAAVQALDSKQARYRASRPPTANPPAELVSCH
jgi:hypothetical protein